MTPDDPARPDDYEGEDYHWTPESEGVHQDGTVDERFGLNDVRRWFLMVLPVVAIAFAIVFISSSRHDPRIVPEPTPVEDPGEDIANILERDTLRVVTGYNPVSYFLHRGQAFGFEYEMLHDLADSLDIHLEILTKDTARDMVTAVRTGEADLIAYNLIQRTDWDEVNGAWDETITFTSPHTVEPLVLVQRKPQGWERMPAAAMERRLVRDEAGLAGRTIHLRHRTPCVDELKAISETLSQPIGIVEAAGDTLLHTDLIRQVAEGEAEFMVALASMARLEAARYPNLDIRTQICDPAEIGFGVRASSPQLAERLGEWVEYYRDTPRYAALRQKYVDDRVALAQRVQQFEDFGDQISEYDDLIKPFADSIGWDWQLMAAQMYQESRFQPAATSFAGARGLMQVMPATGRWLGFSDLYNPQTNLEAATKFIVYLQDFWKNKITDENERLKFILASYNAGPGHVEDARRLTAKHGGDDTKWSEVAVWLERKEEKAVFTDPVVKHGYARGWEPVQYVEKILNRYRDYRAAIARLLQQYELYTPGAGPDAEPAQADAAPST